MALIRCIDNQRFELTNGRISYLFQVSPEGILEHLYFGAYIRIDDSLDELLPSMPRRLFRACTPEFEGVNNYNLSDIAQEYPCFGTSDTRTPAFHACNADGNTIHVLRYQSYQISADKPKLGSLPTARAADSETLKVVLVDALSQIELELYYTIYADHDVIARAARINNNSDNAVHLHHIFSTNLDLPVADYELLHLGGSWSREFNEQRHLAPAGKFAIDASSGVSSNHHNPFLAVMERGSTEHCGRVYAMALVYSGNFLMQTEKSEFDGLRISAGINPFNFNWKLDAGEQFNCPEVLQTFSHKGLHGMSHTWHRFIRRCIVPPAFNAVTRPSYLNTWEALYFDVSAAAVLRLAKKAKALGLEMLVLDDGWFKGRNNNKSSLGDWFADADKFPNGIETVARKVNRLGLKFGLWFEPEMVNEDSDLYRQHPDWVIQVPGRKHSTGRFQLTLDLSQQAVLDYLYQRLDSFLSCGYIHYVKWDMNRLMTNQGSLALAPERQREVAHRYMLGLYQLVDRITTQYPDVLFENCASGGNRFDLGLLSFMAQGWISDMSEPIGRLDIINGASYLYPLDVIASYIGPSPSHQNGRMASLQLREEVGFFAAARGLSLNEADIDKDFEVLQQIVGRYKLGAKQLLGGRFYRLKKTDNEVIWQYISADNNTIYLGYFYLLSAPNQPRRSIRLCGLDSESAYSLQVNYQCDAEKQKRFSGSALMQQGIDLPFISAMQADVFTDYMPAGDFSSRIMVFSRINH